MENESAGIRFEIVSCDSFTHRPRPITILPKHSILLCPASHNFANLPIHERFHIPHLDNFSHRRRSRRHVLRGLDRADAAVEAPVAPPRRCRRARLRVGRVFLGALASDFGGRVQGSHAATFAQGTRARRRGLESGRENKRIRWSLEEDLLKVLF